MHRIWAMPLIDCPDCGREISPRAAHCIGCGCPQSAFFEESQRAPRHLKRVQEMPADQSEPAPLESREPHEEVFGFFRCVECEALFRPSRFGGSKLLCSGCGGEQPASPDGRPYIAGAGRLEVDRLSREGVELTNQQHLARDRLPCWRLWKWERVEGGVGWRPSRESGRVRLPESTWLKYRNSATGATRVVPVQGTLDWWGVLPWLWHIVHWTPARLWVFISWSLYDFLVVWVRDHQFGGEPLSDLQAQVVYPVVRLVPVLFVVWQYIANGTRWRIEYLEASGYRCEAGVLAQTKQEAVAAMNRRGSGLV